MNPSRAPLTDVPAFTASSPGLVRLVRAVRRLIRKDTRRRPRRRRVARDDLLRGAGRTP